MILIIVGWAMPTMLHAAMDNYCSAPPYVTRSIQPNIMILLDNSCDMLNPAYDHATNYDNNTTYTGYFISNAYYAEDNNRFKVVEQNVATSAAYLRTSYVVGATTYTIVYKGNFMNYLIMSRFDLLQKIITGGNAAVPRTAGGASTVRSMSGTTCGSVGAWPAWTTTYLDTTSANNTNNTAYSGCNFIVDSGYLKIEDATPGLCTLPAAVFALTPKDENSTFFAKAVKRLKILEIYDTFLTLLNGTGRLFADAGSFVARSMERIDIVKSAAAVGAYGVSISTSSPLPAGTVTVAYSTTISATVANDSEPPSALTWSITSGSLPPGLTFASTTCSANPSCSITLSGTPATAGTYSFRVHIAAQNSKSPTPRSASVDKDFSLTISSGPSYNLSITTPTLPSGTTSSTYLQTIDVSQTGCAVTPVYTWTLQSGYLPFGLFLTTESALGVDKNGDGDTTDAVISGNTCPFTSTGATTGVIGNSGATCLKTDTFSVVSGKSYQVSTCSTGGDGGSYTGDTWLNLSGVYSGSNDDSCSLGSKLTFTAGSSGTETVCQSTYSAHTVGTGAYPADTTWSYNIKNTTDNKQCADTFDFTVRVSATCSGADMGYAERALSIAIAAITSNRSKTYRLWVDVGKDINNNDLPSDASTGLIQSFWEDARWGMTTFDQVGATVRVKVDECLGGNALTTFLNSIDGTVPSNVTSAHLSDAYHGIIKYFKDESQNSAAGWYGGCTDPFTGDTVSCRKNFVLTLSSAYDVGFNATDRTSYTQATGCAATYSGVTVSTNPFIQNACYAYQNDLRTDKDGTQNLYHYAVYTFAKDTEAVSTYNGNGATRAINKAILKDASLSSGGGKFYDASQGTEVQAKLMQAITDILGKAASGTAVSVLTTSSRGVGSMVQAYFLPTKLEGTRDVLWTGYTQNIWIDPKDNLREDTTNDYQLKLDSTVSGGDNVIKLYFDTAANETKVATFTTDGNGENGTLASCSAPDSAIKAFSDVKYLWEAGKKLALRRPDVDGLIPARNLFTATKVRRGASEIYDFTGDNAFTSSNITNDTSDCSGLSGDRFTLCNALDRDTTDTAAYDGSASNIVRYVRGECLETGVNGNTACGATAGSTYRDRRITVSGGDANGNVWKLGDIISSTPKVFANTPLNTYHIDYGDSTYYNYVTSNGYKRKSSLAFVGANDGVLHAFRVGYLKDTGLDSGVKALFKNFFGTTATDYTTEDTSNPNDKLGDEAWGYIPFNAFPYLKYLANTGYCHIYYNDLSVRLVDASLGCSDASCDGPTEDRTYDTSDSTKRSWRSILIGGMRFGGGCSGGTPDKPATVSGTAGYSAYYAIDITDPENPAPLWEFSDADMGYATTFPSVIRTGDTSKNGYWYAVIGSGSKTMPKSNTDISRADTGYIYILNLKTGELVKKLALDHTAIVGDILAIDADKNYSTEKIYFGTSYLDTTWKGKVVSVAIPNQDLSTWTPNLSTWTEASPTDIKYIFADSYPFTASPDATKDADGNIWVYAGSGKYYSDIDDSDTSTQLFLGIKDKDSGITYPVSTSTTGFVDRTTTDTTYTTITGTSQVCMYDSAAPAGFKFKTVTTSVSGASTVSTPTVGWYLFLTSGERVITRPLAVGGLVDFLTYKPDASDPCSYGGSSYLYAVGYTTGVAPTNIAIMSPDAVSGGTVKKGILLGPGAPPTGEAIIIPPPKEGQETLKKKIQIATGVIIEAENTPVTSVISKVVHWLKK